MPIYLDTEGLQIRTGSIINGNMKLVSDDIAKISNNLISGNNVEFNLCPKYLFGEKIAEKFGLDVNLIQKGELNYSGLHAKRSEDLTMKFDKISSIDIQLPNYNWCSIRISLTEFL